LDGLKQLKSVLFHQDGMRAFREFDITLARRVDEQGKQCLPHVGRIVAVPFGTDNKCGHCNLGWIIKWFARGPKFRGVC